MKILGEQKGLRGIAKGLSQRLNRKTSLTAAVFLVAIFLFVIGGTALGGYTTTQIVQGEIYNSAMNDSGQVVWVAGGYPGASNDEIFLYSDGVTTKLTDNGYSDSFPQINDSGQVVWIGWDGTDYEIFLLSNGLTAQLTNNSYEDCLPQINSSGQVVWEGDGNGIFLYTPGTGTIQLSSNGSVPRINSGGQVVWMGGSWPDYEIFLYSGGTTTQITNNDHWDSVPQINDSGQVVWQGYNSYYDGADSEIFLYGDGVTTQLTNNGYDDEEPQINDAGQVVWKGGFDTGSEIFLNSGGVTTQLTNNGYYDSGPQINEAGQVAWYGYGPNGTDPEIFLYSGGTITQLTDNEYWDWFPQINNSSQVIWETWFSNNGGIFLASSCSDGKPSLTLSRARVYWASYADYQARALSVDYSVANTGGDPARGVVITGSTATNGVSLLTAMPVSVGDLGGGSGATGTLKYLVPTGVYRYRVTVVAEAKDACGNIYTYP